MRALVRPARRWRRDAFATPVQAGFNDVSRACIEHLTLEDRDAVLAAIDAFDNGLDFADALHLARSSRASGFATFDQRLAKRTKGLALVPAVELLA